MAEQTRLHDTRSESHFVLDVPLRVLGIDERNTVFSEETHRRNASRQRVCFIAKKRINPGSAVSIRSFDKSSWSAAVVFQDADEPFSRFLVLKCDGLWKSVARYMPCNSRISLDQIIIEICSESALLQRQLSLCHQ